MFIESETPYVVVITTYIMFIYIELQSGRFYKVNFSSGVNVQSGNDKNRACVTERHEVKGKINKWFLALVVANNFFCKFMFAYNNT